MQQRSKEWFEMRRKHIGASDAPIIMRVSPWMTPYELWQEKLGLLEERRQNAAMQKGISLEPEVLARLEQEIGMLLQPKVMFHPTIPYMMASLDGMSLDGKTIVEIKCPGKADHEEAKAGRIPTKYYPQLQHQIEVCQVNKCLYASFREGELIVIPVEKDCQFIDSLLQSEAVFWDCIVNKCIPEMMDRDSTFNDSIAWESLAGEWDRLTKAAKTIEKEKEEIKSKLIELCEGKSMHGFGVRVTKCSQTRIDYKALEGENIDLNKYKKVSSFWKVTCG